MRFLIKLNTEIRNFQIAHACKMSATKTAAEAWYDCQIEKQQLKTENQTLKDTIETEIKQLKTNILTMKATIRKLQRKEMRREEREKKKREAEMHGIICPVLTLIYDNRVADLELLCAHCQRYLKTL